MSNPLPPEQDIGPYYRLMGVALLFGALLTGGMLAAALLFRVPVSDFAVKVVAVLAGGFLLAMVLVIIRPAQLDSLFKTFVSALPFTKYQKPEAP